MQAAFAFGNVLDCIIDMRHSALSYTTSQTNSDYQSIPGTEIQLTQQPILPHIMIESYILQKDSVNLTEDSTELMTTEQNIAQGMTQPYSIQPWLRDDVWLAFIHLSLNLLEVRMHSIYHY
jgi:hypothetical protein